MKLAAALLIGLALGLGSTLGVQAATDPGTDGDDSHRARVVWEATFKACMSERPPVWAGADSTDPRACRREADAAAR